MITYGYDDLNRLVDEWRKEGENTVYRRQYEYDRVGNRTKLTKNDGGGDTVYGYTYNGLGQLATEYWPEDDPESQNVYSYDGNGNLAQKLEQYGSPGNWGTEYTWTYYWDTQDRLVKVEKYDEAEETYDVCVEYKYCPSCGGALSERIEYESDRSTVKSWLRYQYHGLNLLRIDEKYDTNGENGIQSSDLWRVMNWYVHGPGSIGQTVRATAYSYNHNKTNSPCETNEYYYCYDALGNVNGVLQDGTYYRWETDAFGNDLPGGNEFLPMTSEGPKEHQTGKMFDGETGLYYFHARWYLPEIGRFASVDPRMRMDLSMALSSSSVQNHCCGSAICTAKDIEVFSRELQIQPERFTPYTFVGSCPTIQVDPNGESVVVVVITVTTVSAVVALYAIINSTIDFCECMDALSEWRWLKNKYNGAFMSRYERTGELFTSSDVLMRSWYLLGDPGRGLTPEWKKVVDKCPKNTVNGIMGPGPLR